MRVFIAARARFAEDSLTKAIGRGVSQVVILGAGLDTYAYRTPFRDRLRIFEVDHPDTQVWKRQLLDGASIAIPDSLTFAPVDFEQQTLDEGLAAAGFDPGQQTFFTWLGVVPYLTEGAIWATTAFIASVQGGAHVVFDYSDPPETLSPESRARHDLRAKHVADLGEQMRSYFEADKVSVKLKALGFSEVEDLGPQQIASRYFGSHAGTSDRGGHFLLAVTKPAGSRVSAAGGDSNPAAFSLG